MSSHVRDPACIPSLDDLAFDFSQQTIVASSLLERSQRALADLHAAGNSIPPAAYEEVAPQLRTLTRRIRRHLRALHALRRDARSFAPNSAAVEILTAHKHEQASALRSLHTIAAAAIVATDWASPSVDHAVWSGAGRRTGQVKLYNDDYTRDRHPGALWFERQWLAHYVHDPCGYQPACLMTSGGMAAFVTVLHHACSCTGSGPVLVGAATYHECRRLLEASPLGKRLVALDETDLDSWIRAIDTLRPAAMFIDSLCNASGLAMPDLEAIIEHLVRGQYPRYVVIDNTGRSVAFQPWTRLRPGAQWPVLVAFESITKFAQLGFDQTPAGMIVASPSVRRGLDALREHLGTNVTELAVHQIPAPESRLLRPRLSRLARNCELLARATDRFMQANHLPARVVHPALPGHPSRSVARRAGFTGGFFGIELAQTVDSHTVRRRVVDTVMTEARRRGVPLMEGTSFGFDTTRVYLTAADARRGKPFVRVAAGTEHMAGVQRLTETFIAALGRCLSSGARRTLHRAGELPMEAPPAQGGKQR